jgi:hypothetical protein
MSTYWGYRCETCGVDSPTWFILGQATLREAARRWPEIDTALKLAATLHNFELSITPYQYADPDTGQTLFDFLRAHASHSMKLLSEYGGIVPLEADAESGPPERG